MRDWAWLGTARDDAQLFELLESRQQPAFDVDESAIPFGVRVLAMTALGWMAQLTG